MSHADILDSDRGNIFRKLRHKNNKKSCCYLRENGKKTGRCQGICPPVAMLTRSAYVYNAIFRVHFAYTRDITSQAYARSDAKILLSNGGLPPRKFKRGIGSLFDPVLTLWGGGHIGSSRMEQSYCTSGFFRQRVTARNHSNYQPTPSTEVSLRMISAKTHVVKSASRCA